MSLNFSQQRLVRRLLKNIGAFVGEEMGMLKG